MVARLPVSGGKGGIALGQRQRLMLACGVLFGGGQEVTEPTNRRGVNSRGPVYTGGRQI